MFCSITASFPSWRVKLLQICHIFLFQGRPQSSRFQTSNPDLQENVLLSLSPKMWKTHSSFGNLQITWCFWNRLGGLHTLLRGRLRRCRGASSCTSEHPPTPSGAHQFIYCLLLLYRRCSAAAPYEGGVREEGNEQPAVLLTLTGKRRKVTRTNVFSSLRCLNGCVQDLQGKKIEPQMIREAQIWICVWKLRGCAFILTNWDVGHDQTPFNQKHVNFFSRLSSSSSSVGSSKSALFSTFHLERPKQTLPHLKTSLVTIFQHLQWCWSPVLGGLHQHPRRQRLLPERTENPAGSQPSRTGFHHSALDGKTKAYKTTNPSVQLSVSYILCWSSGRGVLVPGRPASWPSARPSCMPSVSPKVSSSLQLCKKNKKEL